MSQAFVKRLLSLTQNTTQVWITNQAKIYLSQILSAAP